MKQEYINYLVMDKKSEEQGERVRISDVNECRSADLIHGEDISDYLKDDFTLHFEIFCEKKKMWQIIKSINCPPCLLRKKGGLKYEIRAN
jgi:hypothetical protein